VPSCVAPTSDGPVVVSLQGPAGIPPSACSAASVNTVRVGVFGQYARMGEIEPRLELGSSARAERLAAGVASRRASVLPDC
jgi:hypothetical protein